MRERRTATSTTSMMKHLKNRQAWKRLGLLFAFTFVARFALTVSRLSILPANTLFVTININDNNNNDNNNENNDNDDQATTAAFSSNSNDNNSNNNRQQQQLRRKYELFALEEETETKHFELFGIVDPDELQSSDDKEDNANESSQSQPELAEDKFELFGLAKESDSKYFKFPEQQSSKNNDGAKLVELALFARSNCRLSESSNGTNDVNRVRAEGPEPLPFVHSKQQFIPRSVWVQGDGVVDVLAAVPASASSEELTYRASIMAVEGCINLHDFMTTHETVQFTLYHAAHNEQQQQQRQIPVELQQAFSTANDTSQPHTRIVYSATSSEYFGYQTLAHATSFLQSNQTNTSWTRLLSAREPDDLAERFPTFTAPKSLFSRMYSPINKADVIDKWMQSTVVGEAPHPDDTIVVIDPDNWLLSDLHHNWTKDVAPKQAVGQIAYYGYPDAHDKVQELWREVCLENCDSLVDPAGVPYIIKAADLKEVAPLWRSYSISIRERFQLNETFRGKYESLGIEWASEMFGYNHACAHLGIQTKIVDNLQVRDISSTRDWKAWSEHPMIHAGRAFFPQESSELAAPWRHEDNGGFEDMGIQVWCKCNDTAASIQPWPLPPQPENSMDFVSYHTLRLLHDSKEQFGPVPSNDKYRHEDSSYWDAP